MAAVALPTLAIGLSAAPIGTATDHVSATSRGGTGFGKCNRSALRDGQLAPIPDAKPSKAIVQADSQTKPSWVA